MALGCPMRAFVLGDDEVQQLHVLAGSRSLPHSIAKGTLIVLACGAGEATDDSKCVTGVLTGAATMG